MTNPWLQLPTTHPYQLEMDKDVIRLFNSEFRNTTHEIETSLYPEPYIGDLKAPVYVLTTNPSVGDNDHIVHSKSEYIRYFHENILQTVVNHPFLYLNPEFKGTDGYTWWVGKIKAMIMDVGIEHLAKNICGVPFFPYHVKQYKQLPQKTYKGFLPSQKYTQHIIRNAIEQKKRLVIMTGRRFWTKLAPELDIYDYCYESKHPRNRQIYAINRTNLEQYDEIIDIILNS